RLKGSGPGAFDLDYWLHRSEGFRVDSPDGRVGFVAELRFGTSMARPDALAVRAGLFGRLLLIVLVEQVAELLPQERRIVLRGSPRPTAIGRLRNLRVRLRPGEGGLRLRCLRSGLGYAKRVSVKGCHSSRRRRRPESRPGICARWRRS